MKFSPGTEGVFFMKTFHLRGRSPLAKMERFIKALKLVLFDVTLLIIFVAKLVHMVRAELGW